MRAGALLLLLVAPVQAATIVVDTPGDVVASDGHCSLREAVQAANSDVATDTCVAGSGPDVIQLQAGEYSLETGGHLDVTSAVDFVGIPGPYTTIDGESIDRVLVISAGVEVRLDNIYLQGGQAASGNGGAVLSSGSLVLAGCWASANHADGDGAVIYADGPLVAFDSAFWGNTSGGNGGSIYAGGTLALERCDFFGNQAVTGADIVASANGRITQSAFEASDVVAASGQLSIDSSTFSGGVGLAATSGTIILSHATLFSNTVDLAGSIVVDNSILADACGSGISSAGHNISTLGSGCPSDGLGDQLIDASTVFTAELAPLAVYGGITQSAALLDGSHAIDAGTCTTSAGAVITADQRGEPRPQGLRCDIGAFERAQTVLVAVVTLPSGAPCPAGGVQIISGIDSDLDGAIDQVQTTNTLCNGLTGGTGAAGGAGANGASGTDGANGAPGAQGSAGADGVTGAMGADGQDATTTPKRGCGAVSTPFGFVVVALCLLARRRRFS